MSRNEQKTRVISINASFSENPEREIIPVIALCKFYLCSYVVKKKKKKNQYDG